LSQRVRGARLPSPRPRRSEQFPLGLTPLAPPAQLPLLRIRPTYYFFCTHSSSSSQHSPHALAACFPTRAGRVSPFTPARCYPSAPTSPSLGLPPPLHFYLPPTSPHLVPPLHQLLLPYFLPRSISLLRCPPLHRRPLLFPPLVRLRLFLPLLLPLSFLTRFSRSSNFLRKRWRSWKLPLHKCPL